MNYNAGFFDVIIVGGGHAGCEAALACARIGLKTVLFAINLDSIAMMPCNPNIGGTSKGHLVREIDALGGEMAKNIDKTFIQSRMLNTGKGPAVYSLRAQADKFEYAKQMKKTLENTNNLYIKQGEVTQILAEKNKVCGVILESGAIYNSKAVVICTGTYLKSRCLFGQTIIQSGPNGFKSSNKLGDSLKKLGIKMFRFKTGTPARIDKRSIDFSKMQIQYGDKKIVPFSFETSFLEREQIPCYLTYTNAQTCEIIKQNLSKSPMYSGIIEGTGTRYCPSIEDKVVRFSDKLRHQVFIEPEGENTNEMYAAGLSTSLPEDVQIKMYRTVTGLEKCEFMRTGYAIEYDCIDATQLKLSLEFKNIAGLFSAGQFNGSSGYEEAAAQGIIAGINAAMYVQKKSPLIIDRSEGYIGVLIDDMVTKGSNEPYRMLTSRAEYRLLLRQDNADLRLTPKGFEVGLIKSERYEKFLDKQEKIRREIERVSKVFVKADEKTNKILCEHNSHEISNGLYLSELIKRPQMNYEILEAIDNTRPNLDEQVREQVNIQIKYEGYINRQINQVEKFKRLENKKLPLDLDYKNVKGLSIEAAEHLNKIKPENVGQALRIAGVSHADISVLLIFLKHQS